MEVTNGSRTMMPEKRDLSASAIPARKDFAQELRAAIKASGLSLDRIHARLARHGVPVSVTALSYWQSGKRQPERARSLLALRVLEHILRRPEGSLVELLPPPRPRGPGSSRTAG